MHPKTHDQIIDEIFTLFRQRGDMEYGESVTERMHALQCGVLAQDEGQSAELVAASFLHDIGHLVHNMGEDIADQGVDAKHEDLGDAWLRGYFPPEVTEPVRMHVDAKRYLCTVDPEYRAGLSPASEQSFILQGGEMSPEELAAFSASPHFDNAITLRRYDDTGKDPNLAEVDLERFRPVLLEVLERHAATT